MRALALSLRHVRITPLHPYLSCCWVLLFLPRMCYILHMSPHRPGPQGKEAIVVSSKARNSRTPAASERAVRPGAPSFRALTVETNVPCCQGWKRALFSRDGGSKASRVRKCQRGFFSPPKSSLTPYEISRSYADPMSSNLAGEFFSRLPHVAFVFRYPYECPPSRPHGTGWVGILAFAALLL